nr:FAD:protein FMN transferase [Mesorhizobium sp.]
MAHLLDRRRFISIAASAAGLVLLPSGASAREMQTVTWEGNALGAAARITLDHPDKRVAELLIRQAVAEAGRLERIFSLYRSDSALSELNRIGALATPPTELVAVLQTSREVWDLTGGAFDPTVQPLWTLLADHFGGAKPDPSGPTRERLGEALQRVGLDKVAFSATRIAFERPGMALTLNGIAQGFITDRIVDVLRRGGVTKTLVDMGEIRAVGSRPDGSPWKVGIEDPRDEGGLATILEVEDRAVSTSSGEGFRFDAAGHFNHLIDPCSGFGAGRYRSVAVVAPDATAADAFSTAFSLLEADEVGKIVDRRPGLRAHLFDRTESVPPLVFGGG